MNKETRNTLIVAGLIIFTVIAPAIGILDQGTAMTISGLLGGLGGLVYGFNWVQNRRKQNQGDLDE